jgi:hypothetical protein
MTDEYVIRIIRAAKWNLYIISASLVGWALTPYKLWFAGFGLGMVVGLLNQIYAAWKINKLGEVAAAHNGEKKPASLGLATRYSMAILATLIVLKLPEHFSMIGMVVGLMLPTFVALADAVYIQLKDVKIKGRKG